MILKKKKTVKENISVPYEFYKLFFDDVYLSQIIKNSNEYLHLKKKKANNEENIQKLLDVEKLLLKKLKSI